MKRHTNGERRPEKIQGGWQRHDQCKEERGVYYNSRLQTLNLRSWSLMLCSSNACEAPGRGFPVGRIIKPLLCKLHYARGQRKELAGTSLPISAASAQNFGPPPSASAGVSSLAARPKPKESGRERNMSPFLIRHFPTRQRAGL